MMAIYNYMDLVFKRMKEKKDRMKKVQTQRVLLGWILLVGFSFSPAATRSTVS